MVSRWLCVMLLLNTVYANAPEYTNPIVQEDGIPDHLGDPGAIFVDGFYYLATSTGDLPDAFPIHRSADLVTWTLVGHVFPEWQSIVTWAKGDFWAPDLQVVNGKFACYFSAHSKGALLSPGVLSLGVAFSDDITGPYVDIGHALYSGSNWFGTIDVHFHETALGEKYLLWKENQDVAHLEFKAHLRMQRLADDGASLSSAPTITLATADQAWETDGCVEAPWLIERKGSFYLFYSGSVVTKDSYAVGVSRADSIEGPYTKKMGPVLHKCGYSPPSTALVLEAVESGSASSAEAAWTPGHCSVLAVAGQVDRWVMFYHGRRLDHTNRTLMMDELKWGEDGWPHIESDCPSFTATPVPGHSVLAVV